jgi:hypothetical protein
VVACAITIGRISQAQFLAKNFAVMESDLKKFKLEKLAAKVMKCTSFPNLALSTTMVLMDVFPIFSYICPCLSKPDIDSSFNSHLIPYLFHILFVFVVIYHIYVCTRITKSEMLRANTGSS